MRPALMLLWIWILFWGIATVVAGYGYYQFYWKWRNCFNDEGRCFDTTDSVVYHSQSGVALMAIGTFSAICLALGLIKIIRKFGSVSV